MLQRPQVASIDVNATLSLTTSALRGPQLVDELLHQQQSLSAVEHFSAWHQDHTAESKHSPPSTRYRALLPAGPPGPGQQYAFEVDLDRCSGCKACVAACHTLNGLGEGETWRDVGLLVGGGRSLPVLQHVTTACHHCLEPACLTACPVNAYEKDPLTGIVKHLDDQCFGCQYCIMACPYEVPKYHHAKGIVRKCDMCSSRLAVGEPPGCVQACPHEAIAIRVVDREQVREDSETAVFLPAAPDPQITLPTTTFKSQRSFPRNLLPADYLRVSPQHAHWPLVVMLTLTQLSVGAFLVGQGLQWFGHDDAESRWFSFHAIQSIGFGLLALAASVFHLGRPQYAYRAVLGLGHSWLSREIVAFGVFAALASLYALLILMSGIRPELLANTIAWHPWMKYVGWGVAASGVAGMFCSAMIYVFTRREYWSFARVSVRFGLTAAVLGIAATWLSILTATLIAPPARLTEVVRQQGALLCCWLLLLNAVKLAWESAIFRHLLSSRMTPLKRSALLLTRDLSSVTLARFALGLLGGVVMPALLWTALRDVTNVNLIQIAATTGVMFIACFVGEILERYQFFAACAAPRMPGGIR